MTKKHLAPGCAVQVRYSTTPEFYPGKVEAVENERYAIAYDDGDRETGVVRRRIRLPGQKQKFVLRQGAEVDARYGKKEDVLPGRVVAVNDDGSYDVAFDQGEVVVEGLERKFIFADFTDPTLPEGTRVECRYADTPKFYPGVVKAIADDGSSYSIIYDDGDEEADVVPRRIRLAGQKQRRLLRVGEAVDARSDSGKVRPGTVTHAATRVLELDNKSHEETLYAVSFDHGEVVTDLERKYIFAEFFSDDDDDDDEAPEAPSNAQPITLPTFLGEPTPAAPRNAIDARLSGSIALDDDDRRERPIDNPGFEAPASPPIKRRYQSAIDVENSLLIIGGGGDIESSGNRASAKPVRRNQHLELSTQDPLFATRKSDNSVFQPTPKAATLESPLRRTATINNMNQQESHRVITRSTEGNCLQALRPAGVRGCGLAAGVAFTPCGRIVAAATRSRIALWLARKGHHIGNLSGHTGRVLALKCERLADDSASPKPPRTPTILVSGGSDGMACVWRLPCETRRSKTVDDDVSDEDETVEAAWTSFSQRMARKSRAKSRNVAAGSLWDLMQPVAIHRHPHGSWVLGVDVSRRNLLATAASDGVVRIWKPLDSDDDAMVIALDGHHWYATAVAFAPGAELLASGSMDRTLRVWSYAATSSSANEQLVVESGTGASEDLSSIDRLSALGREVPIQQVPCIVLSHAEPIYSVAWTPDGTRLVAGSNGGSPHVWNYHRGAFDEHFEPTGEGHVGPVVACATSKDGTFLVTASHDGTTRYWSVPDNNNPNLFERESSKLQHVCSCTRTGGRFVGVDTDGGALGLSARGATRRRRPRIVTLSADGTVRIWHAPSGVAKIAERRALTLASLRNHRDCVANSATHLAVRAALNNASTYNDGRPMPAIEVALGLRVLVRAILRSLPRDEPRSAHHLRDRSVELQTTAHVAEQLAACLGNIAGCSNEEIHVDAAARIIAGSRVDSSLNLVRAAAKAAGEIDGCRVEEILARFIDSSNNNEGASSKSADDIEMLVARSHARIDERSDIARQRTVSQSWTLQLGACEKDPMPESIVDMLEAKRFDCDDLKWTASSKGKNSILLRADCSEDAPIEWLEEVLVQVLETSGLVANVNRNVTMTRSWNVQLVDRNVTDEEFMNIVSKVDLDEDVDFCLDRREPGAILVLTVTVRVAYASIAFLDWLEEQLIDLCSQHLDKVKSLDRRRPHGHRTDHAMPSAKSPPPPPLTTRAAKREWILKPTTTDVSPEKILDLIGKAPLIDDDVTFSIEREGTSFVLCATTGPGVPMDYLEEALFYFFEETHTEVLKSIDRRREAPEPRSQEVSRTWLLTPIDDQVSAAQIQSMLDRAELDDSVTFTVRDRPVDNRVRRLELHAEERSRAAFVPFDWLEEQLLDFFENSPVIMRLTKASY